MKTIIIAAIAENNVIGNDDKIPWHIKEDFKLFKEKTINNVVVMGRKTYESIGKALPNRKNIVVSRTISNLADANIYSSYDDAISAAKSYAKENTCDVFIIGGATLYNKAILACDELYISHVKGTYEGNVFFPTIDSTMWVIKEEKPFDKFTFKRYVRK